MERRIGGRGSDNKVLKAERIAVEMLESEGGGGVK
jgi:hypothetical protein